MSERSIEAPEDDQAMGVEGQQGEGLAFMGEFGERELGDAGFMGEFGEREHEGRANVSQESDADVPPI